MNQNYIACDSWFSGFLKKMYLFFVACTVRIESNQLYTQYGFTVPYMKRNSTRNV